MKKIIWLVVFLPMYGCVISTPGTNANNDACPSQPTAALEEGSYTEEISIKDGAVSKSGQINIGQQKGYIFTGEPGQELSYRTDDNICIWVYAPDSTLMSSNVLDKKGKYTLQVASLQGATAYELDIGFGELSNTDPSASNTQNSGTSDSGSPDTAPPDQAESNNATLSQTDAKSLVEKWLNAKSDIFAPPFDRELLAQLTTGLLYEDIAKQNGSIDWLRNNNSYHVYNNSSVKEIWSFDNSNSRPSIKVSIYEDHILYENGRRNNSQSGTKTKVYTYFFSKDNGKWKIDDYQES
jgi:hypothetical protein